MKTYQTVFGVILAMYCIFNFIAAISGYAERQMNNWASSPCNRTVRASGVREGD